MFKGRSADIKAVTYSVCAACGTSASTMEETTSVVTLLWMNETPCFMRTKTLGATWCCYKTTGHSKKNILTQNDDRQVTHEKKQNNNKHTNKLIFRFVICIFVAPHNDQNVFHSRSTEVCVHLHSFPGVYVFWTCIIHSHLGQLVSTAAASVLKIAFILLTW